MCEAVTLRTTKSEMPKGVKRRIKDLEGKKNCGMLRNKNI